MLPSIQTFIGRDEEYDADLWECMNFDEKNWGKHLQCGFNMKPDEDDDGEADAGLLIITKLISERFSGYFQHGFSERVVISLWIYGSYIENFLRASREGLSVSFTSKDSPWS